VSSTAESGVALVDRHVVSVGGQRPQVLDLGVVEIDQMDLLERGPHRERVQRAPGDELASRLRYVLPSTGEGIDVHVVELGLLAQDRGVRRRVLVHDVELDLRPVADLVEAQVAAWWHRFVLART